MDYQNEKYCVIDLNSDAFDYSGTFNFKSVVDWSKLEYNSVYKSFDYFRDKFPVGFDYLPGFNDIIQKMADNAKSPYEEMMEIINVLEPPVPVKPPLKSMGS